MAFLKEYTLLEELGKGGFATVYKVKHNALGYIRAIRVLNEVINSEDSPAYQKFLRECKVLLRLGNGNHKNIVHIYQPRFLENHALVEMDYVDGCDISKYLRSNGNFLPTEEVLRMVEEMSGALAYCHEDIYKYCMDRDEDHLADDPNDGSKVLIDNATKQRLIEKYKVIHNDIHSGNIMRRDDGSFVLLDFGLAITGNDDVRHSSRHDNGAIEFKAPEKWDNEALLTEQTDIYSFGVVMYEYLAGRVPFPFNKKALNRTEEEFLLSRAHKMEQPPAIFDIRKANYEAKYPGETYKKDYPDWLEEAIMKCLEKDPGKRFRNGKELHDYVVKNIRKDRTLAKKLASNIVAVNNRDNRVESGNKNAKSLSENSKNAKKRRKSVLGIVIPVLLAAILGALFFLTSRPKEMTKDEAIHFIETYHQNLKAGKYDNIADMFAPDVERYFRMKNIKRDSVVGMIENTNENDTAVYWVYDWNTLSVNNLEDGSARLVFSYDFIRNSGKGKGTYVITTEMTLNPDHQILSVYDIKSDKKGAINCVFSVSSSKKVQFSQGNLQYQASTNTWRFAEHQWDIIGEANKNISSSYSGWIDLFGWGTSGYNGKNPWMTSTTSTDYGNGERDIAGTNYDWGVNNTISNGGGYSWRTLTRDEWVYVFNTRSTSSGIRYAKATVNGVNGVILLSDNWSSSNYSLSNTNKTDASFNSNKISQTNWQNKFEANGAVFLPATGYRYGTSVGDVVSYGYYWSASCDDSNYARYVWFNDSDLYPGDWHYRYYGRSVRLVCPAEN